MATFNFNFRQEFTVGGTFLGNPSGNTGTLSDNQAGNTQFSVGEELSGAGPGVGGGNVVDFMGTFTQVIQGQTITFVVGRETSGQQQEYFVYAQTSLTTAQVRAGLPTDITPGGTPIWITTPFTVCFAPGTLIATPDGERAVETLAIGDIVQTADGRAVAVRWMGRNTVHKATHANVAPVRVKAGALGSNVPHTDLVLTGDHALIVDGLAINASALVNGTTIAWEPIDALPDQMTYWHIETEAHDEILANGAPAETFVDYVARKSFDNHQEYLDLYGAERIVPEMLRPRISARRQLPAALAARLGIGSFGDAVEAEFDGMVARLSAA